MSLLIFPTLIGMSWPVTRKREFSTIVQTAQSGKEIRLANYGQARYSFKLVFDYLPGDPAIGTDYQTLFGFMELQFSELTPFWFQDKYDYQTTLSNFGTGDGTTLSFQLARIQGGASHLLYGIASSPAPEIYINGALQGSGYTISSTGLVTFSVAPGAGLPLTWSGQYYFVVRFQDEGLELDQTCEPYYELKECNLIECIYGL
jgi:uncharacterized protein (TIGR02217 family)